MDHAVCIHGHFYQPPRENPWLCEVEFQESARPFHDWNERITSECYAPNTRARIIGKKDLIAEVLNIYARISFSAGPTLLSWLERHRPDVYRAIIEADAEAQQRFSGHGSAIAQAYNHLIMPLATTRDKRTQVVWGIRDFESRFRRRPEGMWLPETAVDLESLDIMAEQGIRFTLLAPHQAGRVRAPDGEWREANHNSIDTTRPYLCRLPSGRTISIFFFDTSISHEVAFGNLLEDGRRFADRLLGAFSTGDMRDQLVHIATDGETYGHHRRFGEMALAYCIRSIESGAGARLTIYGEYLARHPSIHEVEIRENTSWSCAHGVERWRSNCGCSIGGRPGWTQEWRRPLRDAIDGLRDVLAPLYEQAISAFVHDPWQVRDDYIEAVLGWSAGNVRRFLLRNAVRDLSDEEDIRVLKLLEMQRHAMLMQTSCGWFFDEISDLGSVQVMRHAARAMQLAQEISGSDFEPKCIEALRRAPSNIQEYRSGADVYAAEVRPAVMDMMRVGAHAAVQAVFTGSLEATETGCHAIGGTVFERIDGVRRHGIAGMLQVRSRETWDGSSLDFAVLQYGVDRVIAGVREHAGDDALRAMCRDIRDVLLDGMDDLNGLRRIFSRHFAGRVYTEADLSADERRWMLARITAARVAELQSTLCRVYRDQIPVLHAFAEMRVDPPKFLADLRSFAWNFALLSMLEEGELDPDLIRAKASAFKAAQIEPDLPALNAAASRRITALMAAFAKDPDNISLLKRVEAIVGLQDALALSLDLWESQNILIAMRGLYRKKHRKAAAGDAAARAWVEAFRRVGSRLKVRVT